MNIECRLTSVLSIWTGRSGRDYGRLSVNRRPVMLEVGTVLQSKTDWMFNAPMDVGFVHDPLPAGGIG